MFQPSIVGLECEGISEILEHVVKSIGDCETRNKILDFVLLAGGNTLVKGFDARVKRELQMVSPVDQKINVVNAFDARLDAWRGGAEFAASIV